MRKSSNTKGTHTQSDLDGFCYFLWGQLVSQYFSTWILTSCQPVTSGQSNSAINKLTLQNSLSYYRNPQNQSLQMENTKHNTRDTQNSRQLFNKSPFNITPVEYLWRELLQVSFCCDKNMLVATKLCLSRQTSVARNICGNKQFCYNKTTSILLSQQKCVCCNKSMLVATKLLS